MQRLIEKYTGKIVSQHLAADSDIHFLCLDADLYANRTPDDTTNTLRKVFDRLNINSLLAVHPAEPYRTIIASLISREPERITPSDCETRTFFHDIPVIPGFDADSVAEALARRKAAVLPNGRIVSAGTVSPEQAFISFSSVCFATFVKYFSDLLYCASSAPFTHAYDEFRAVIRMLPRLKLDSDPFLDSPPSSDEEIVAAMSHAGTALVERSLVDSYFGNISYTSDGTIFISQTGSSMDELQSAVDAVPLDGSSSSGITASSELSAHIGIFRATGRRAILHGHPKFTVIMSMSCRSEECDLSSCYRTCDKPRSLFGIPVVSGEIGTGPAGLFRTVPAAMGDRGAVIVFGHGIFAAGQDRFTEPFVFIEETEERSRHMCLEKIGSLLSHKK